MRRRLEEPRQVRKEAAAFAMVVCCGVPDLFLSYWRDAIIVYYFVLHAPKDQQKYLTTWNRTHISNCRRWRPKQFSELVGQDHVVRTLGNAIDLGRIAHAYLFVGPRGTGKTTSARLFAKSLNWEKGPSLEVPMTRNWPSDYGWSLSGCDWDRWCIQ